MRSTYHHGILLVPKNLYNFLLNNDGESLQVSKELGEFSKKLKMPKTQ
jgi:hypothetical protein